MTSLTWRKIEKEKREYKNEKRLDNLLSKSLKTEIQMLLDFYLRTG